MDARHASDWTIAQNWGHRATSSGGLRALALGQLPQLARLYWYTVEFDFQQCYFVIRSLDELLAFAQADFAPLYARIKGLPEIAPNEQVLGDEPVQ